MEASSDAEEKAVPRNPCMARLVDFHDNEDPRHALFADMIIAKVIREDLVPGMEMTCPVCGVLSLCRSLLCRGGCRLHP